MYLVIFDCDGTLIDSQDTIVHGIDVGFAAVGLAPPDRATGSPSPTRWSVSALATFWTNCAAAPANAAAPRRNSTISAACWSGFRHFSLPP